MTYLQLLLVMARDPRGHHWMHLWVAGFRKLHERLEAIQPAVRG